MFWISKMFIIKTFKDVIWLAPVRKKLCSYRIERKQGCETSWKEKLIMQKFSWREQTE